MKKITLTLLAITLVISNLIANPVDQATARKVGASFAQGTLPSMRSINQMELVKATEAYYVFNIGQTGFVIVSANDSFRPIVGYSDEGVFPSENPSPEMMYYLDNLSQGRQAALRAAVVSDERIREEWNALLNGEKMAPRNDLRSGFHLVQTRWNQNYPYNKFCPRAEGEGLPYAGCVATAMSQVMNYWKYPTHGYGNHSYSYAQYGVISADFSTATYEFDLMQPSISELSPAEEVDPIAFFMYHCGVAVDMMYGTDGSGAYSEDVPEAVMKYFGYTNRCRIIYRDSYSLEEFQNVLKDQFDIGWPCYYSGSDTDGGGGHAFVCDGYDENDLFHFNWGWSASGDGYYAIDELNVSSYAFNSGQGVVTNYVPEEVFLYTAKAPEFFTAVPLGDAAFSVELSWVNPTTTLDGRPLESIDQILVMRDGVVVHTFDNLVPGETMSFVDVTGLPISVDYSIQAVCHGCTGRKAYFKGVNLGPSCPWTAHFRADGEGWGNGEIAIVNASGVTVAELTADRGEQDLEFELPQGWISFHWTAPSDSLGIGIEIFDAEGQTVFAYEGPSTLMPEGMFYKMVNTCGGQGNVETPSNLRATVTDEDVTLQWDEVADPGFGYCIYRDGFFYSMVPDITSFTDAGAAATLHNYYVTVFAEQGESDPSNTVSTVVETPEMAPRDLEIEILASGKVKITWNAPEQTEGLAGYQVFRKPLGGEYKRVKTCGAETQSYTDGFNVPNGNRYYYKVIAAHERGYDESSPARSLRHPELHYVEVNRTHIPDGLTLEPQDNQLLLQWEAPMLAETYNVYCNGEQIASGLVEPTFTDIIRGDALMYQVTGVLNGVESSPSNKAVYGNYAVGEHPELEVTLFPNPANGRVSVKAEDLLEIAVYDVAGRQVLHRIVEGNEAQVDLTDLNQGVYFFRVSTKQGCLLQKVVLMK